MNNKMKLIKNAALKETLVSVGPIGFIWGSFFNWVKSGSGTLRIARQENDPQEKTGGQAGETAGKPRTLRF